MATLYDVIIIGRGPAGLSCAIYASRAKLSTLVLGLEPKLYGNYRIDNYFGFEDGIEAKGLDENLDLVVDRTPKFGILARSTPELIVERLSKLAKSPKKEVYTKILENLTRVRTK